MNRLIPVLTAALLCLTAAHATAQLPRNAFVTAPMTVPNGSEIRCLLSNLSGFELTNLTTLVLVSPLSTQVADETTDSVAPLRQTSLTYLNEINLGSHQCTFSYRGGCTGVTASACVLGSPSADLRTCLQATPVACRDPEILSTAAVKVGRFAWAACAVSTGDSPAEVIALILDKNGNEVARRTDDIEPNETMILRYRSWIGGHYSCRAGGSSDDIRARIFVEDYEGNSTDGSEAR